MSDRSIDIRVIARDAFSRVFNALNAKMTQTTSAFRRLRSDAMAMSFGITAPLTMFAHALINTGQEYSAHLNAIRGAMSASAQDMIRIQETIMANSRQWYQLPTNLAEGMERLAHAYGESFSDINEMLTFYNALVPFATAAQWGMEESARALIGIMNQYQVPLSQVVNLTDILTNTALATVADMRDIATALNYVGPVANQAGMSLNATASALGLLAQAGLPASMVGTSLRNIIQNLLLPTGRYAGLLQSVGGGFKYTADGALDFGEILTRMSRLLREGRIAPEQIIGMIGKRGGPGFLALIQKGGAALDDFIEKTRRSGTTSAYAQEQLQGFAGSWGRLQAAWERFKISLTEGAVGKAFTVLFNFLSTLLDIMSELPEEIYYVIGSFLAIMAIMGPLIYSLGALTKAFSLLMANPVLLFLALLAMTLIDLKRQWDAVARSTEAGANCFQNLGWELQIVLVAVTAVQGAMEVLKLRIQELIMFGQMAAAMFRLVGAYTGYLNPNYATSADYRAQVQSEVEAATFNLGLMTTGFLSANARTEQRLGEILGNISSGKMFVARIEIQPSEGLNAVIRGVPHNQGFQLNIRPPVGAGVGNAPYYNPSSSDVTQAFLGG